MGLFDKIKNVFKKDNDEEMVKYDEGLKKTRAEFVSKLGNLSKKYKFVNEEYFEELEEIMIMADLGVSMVMEFVDRLKKRAKQEHISDTNMLKELIVDELFIMYAEGGIVSSTINIDSNPTVMLFVGVNGVGKTTTIAKIAKKYQNQGKKVLLVAGDTFRAGAVEQLTEWGKKLNATVISSPSKDPSSVIFDGIDIALNEKYDIILIDTAGRLQNKDNLMKELEKINKVIKSKIPDAPHEVLLVIDATTGQNGIIQARAFQELIGITGIVLTKLDGTAKGGIVLAVKNAVDIPVKLVGLGEKMDDLEEFDVEKYIYGLFKDF